MPENEPEMHNCPSRSTCNRSGAHFINPEARAMTHAPSLRGSSPLLRLSLVCVLLAGPVIFAVVYHIRALGFASAQIARERTGLECAIAAGRLLEATQGLRVEFIRARPMGDRLVRARENIGASLARLAQAPCRSLVAGPRMNLRSLAGSVHTLLTTVNRAAAAAETVTLADHLLAVFVDIGDASGLTYDPTVDAVNIDDAVVARIPDRTERLDESAQILALRGTARKIARSDVIAIEKLAGQVVAIDAMASDDFDGAALALPYLGPALRPARSAADRTAAMLEHEIDRRLEDGTVAGQERTLATLRSASIAAGQALLAASVELLERSFATRTALLQREAQITAILGVVGLLVECAIATALGKLMQRNHRRELQLAQERSQVLETRLAHQNAQRALRMTEQQFAAVFEGSSVGIAIVDRATGRLDANTALREMFSDDLRALTDPIQALSERAIGDRRSSARVERCFERIGRPPIWVELSLSPVADVAGEETSAILLVHDITEHKTLTAQLDHEVLHDALTGLPNRVFFMRRIESFMRLRSDRFAVVFIDLDNFKAVNDGLGHHIGDETLQEAARRLSSAVRPIDFVARLHGDEFAVVLSDIGADNGAELGAVVDRIRAALTFVIETPNAPIRLSASIGYVSDGRPYRDAETLLRDADSAMYDSKLAGRDRATVYERV
jgi:diguanylate cyclase (GGDEF)-like protein